ncbi:uncharacterized protein [Callorhinus ursinus]|uniref:uncharacterized protein n=1 Tax=Callorhinus ursinus TaxID=34884 RepID=UPI003CD01422
MHIGEVEPEMSQRCREVGVASMGLGEGRGTVPTEPCGKGLSFGWSECRGVWTNPEMESSGSSRVPDCPHLSSGLGQVLGPEVETAQGRAQQESRVRHPPRSRNQSLDLSPSARDNRINIKTKPNQPGDHEQHEEVRPWPSLGRGSFSYRVKSNPRDARALRPLLCPASGPNPDVSSQSQHVPNLLMNCSSLAKPNQSSCVGVQLMCIPGPGAGDKAWRQEPQGKRTVGPPSHKARDGHLSAAGVFFCENLSSVPALLLLQGPAYLCHCTFPGHFVSSFTRASTDGSQRPCPDLQAQTWELKCRIRKLKSSHLLQNPPRALLPRALGSWEKVSNLLFTHICCGLAVCGRHLCIHR